MILVSDVFFIVAILGPQLDNRADHSLRPALHHYRGTRPLPNVALPPYKGGDYEWHQMSC